MGQRVPTLSSQPPFQPPPPELLSRMCALPSPSYGAEWAKGEYVRTCPHVSTLCTQSPSQRQTHRQTQTQVATGTRSSREWRRGFRSDTGKNFPSQQAPMLGRGPCFFLGGGKGHGFVPGQS